MTAPLPHYHAIHSIIPRGRQRTYRHRVNARLALLGWVRIARILGIKATGDIDTGYLVGDPDLGRPARYSIQECHTLDCPDPHEDHDYGFDDAGRALVHHSEKAMLAHGRIWGPFGSEMLEVDVAVPHQAVGMQERHWHYHAYRSSEDMWTPWWEVQLDAITTYLTVKGWLIEGSELFDLDIEGCCPRHGYSLKASVAKESTDIRVLACRGSYCKNDGYNVWGPVDAINSQSV